MPTTLPPGPTVAELAEVRSLAALISVPSAYRAVRATDLQGVLPPTGRDFELVPALPGAARDRLLRRLPHGNAISAAADRHQVDSLLLAAVVEAESGFNSRVVSSRGATGLMQIMPSLASNQELDLFDPAVNLNLGARYMSQLLRRFGDTELALAAYNAGPGAVEKYGGMPPYRETNRFVRKVLTIYDGHRRRVAGTPAGSETLANRAVLVAR